MTVLKQKNKKKTPTNLDDAKKLIEVKLRKDPTEGFGINLVGGTDKQHLAGHSDIFVSRIRPETPAARDSRLEPGDIIVSINGIDLSEVTHGKALRLFRTARKVSEIVVEKDGEKRILSNNLDFPEGTFAAIKAEDIASKNFQDKNENGVMDKPNVSTFQDTTEVLSDDEKLCAPLNSPGSAKFFTRRQLLHRNQKLVINECSSTPYVKSDEKIQKLSFSVNDDQETASAEDSKESDEESTAASSTSADPSCFSPAVKKPSDLDYTMRVSLNEIAMSLGVVVLSATLFFAYRLCKKH